MSVFGIVEFTNNLSCCPSSNSSMHLSTRLYYYSIITLAPLNVIGNLIALVVLSDKVWNRSVFTTILKAISIFEILFNAFSVIINVSSLTEPLIPFLGYGDRVVAGVEVLLLFTEALLIGSQMARNWSVTMLALFRYDMVCRSSTVIRRNHATQSNTQFFSNQVMPWFFMGIFVFFTLFSIPRMFESNPVICQTSAVICSYNDNLYTNKIYQYAYLTVGMFLFQSGGPILITAVVSQLVIRKILKRNRIRKRSGISQANTSQNSGNLVLAVCVLFAILELPSFYNKLEPIMFLQPNPIFMCVANFLIYLDSSLNLVIYLASNSTFRVVCRRKFCCFTNEASATNVRDNAKTNANDNSATVIIMNDQI